MTILRELRAVRRVGTIICSLTWKMPPEAAHYRVVDEDIFQRMKEHAQGDIVMEKDDGI